MNANQINEYLEKAYDIISLLPGDITEKDLFEKAVKDTAPGQEIPNLAIIIHVFQTIRQHQTSENPLVNAKLVKTGTYLTAAEHVVKDAICMRLSSVMEHAGTAAIEKEPQMEKLAGLCQDLIFSLSNGQKPSITIPVFAEINRIFGSVKTSCTLEQLERYHITDMQKHINRAGALLQLLI